MPKLLKGVYAIDFARAEKLIQHATSLGPIV